MGGRVTLSFARRGVTAYDRCVNCDKPPPSLWEMRVGAFLIALCPDCLKLLDRRVAMAAGRLEKPEGGAVTDEQNKITERILKNLAGEGGPKPRPKPRRPKTTVAAQMPCGCLVGNHPPGPCGVSREIGPE